MTYRFTKSYPDRLFHLPGEVTDKLDIAGETELKILLLAAQHLSRSEVEEEDLLSLLESRFSREETLSALAFWRGCGILKGDSRKKKEEKPVSSAHVVSEGKAEPSSKTIDADEAPFYSAKDLADAAERENGFKALVAFCEERLEKVMNQSELARLYSFLDYLKMPVEVVMLVVEDAVSRDKKSLRYITKVLTSFQDEGIDTYEKAEAHFRRRAELTEYASYVRRLFGWGDRKLSRSEEEIIETWRDRYQYGEDMLDAAYEKTVASAKNPSVKYMHKILESWFAQGFVSPEDTLSGNGQEGKADKSYQLDDFFQKAVSKGRKNL